MNPSVSLRSCPCQSSIHENFKAILSRTVHKLVRSPLQWTMNRRAEVCPQIIHRLLSVVAESFRGLGGSDGPFCRDLPYNAAARFKIQKSGAFSHPDGMSSGARESQHRRAGPNLKKAAQSASASPKQDSQASEGECIMKDDPLFGRGK
jgi:hypothetical protein